MRNFGRQSYSYVPINHGSFASCGPIIAHPSGIPSPRSLPSNPYDHKHEGRGVVSAEKDGLELKIGPPQAPQGSKLSSPASGAISVT